MAPIGFLCVHSIRSIGGRQVPAPVYLEASKDGAVWLNEKVSPKDFDLMSPI
jgi:hypothetical protein